jgi:hypothetical protein
MMVIGVSDNTVHAVRRILAILDGMGEDEVIDVVVNVTARALMCQSPTLDDAKWMAAVATQDIVGCIECNWPNIERERAPYGGRHPTAGEGESRQ